MPPIDSVHQLSRDVASPSVELAAGRRPGIAVRESVEELAANRVVAASLKYFN